MFFIAGVTGHTGRIAAETLLGQGEKVRVLVRDAGQGEPWRKRGAEVVVGLLGDVALMSLALAGTAGAYLLLPPRFDTDDVIGANRALAEALAEAIKHAGARHVVFLSSIGAELPKGTGPIQTLHHAEEKFRAAAKNFTALRAAYFFENWAPVLPATQGGALPTFLTADRRVPMVASADIGRCAAELLLEPASGTRVVDLSCWRDWSPVEIAAGLSRIVGRSVVAQPAPLEGVVPAFTGMGMPRGLAELYREMIQAFNEGRVHRGGSPNVLRRFGMLGAGDVLKTLLEPAPART